MTRSSLTTPPVPTPPAQPGWTSCPACGWLLYRKRLERDLYVCAECDAHLRLSTGSPIPQLVDAESSTEAVCPRPLTAPLSFVARRASPDRLRDATRRSG